MPLVASSIRRSSPSGRAKNEAKPPCSSYAALLHAAHVGALTEEVVRMLIRPVTVCELLDPFVNLTEDRLVLRQPTLLDPIY